MNTIIETTNFKQEETNKNTAQANQTLDLRVNRTKGIRLELQGDLQGPTKTTSEPVHPKIVSNPKSIPTAILLSNKKGVKFNAFIGSLNKHYEIREDYSIVEAPKTKFRDPAQSPRPQNRNTPLETARDSKKRREAMIAQFTDQELLTCLRQQFIIKAKKSIDYHRSECDEYMKYLSHPRKEIDLGRGRCCFLYTWNDCVGIAIYNTRRRKILKTHLIMIQDVLTEQKTNNLGAPARGGQEFPLLDEPRPNRRLGNFNMRGSRDWFGFKRTRRKYGAFFTKRTLSVYICLAGDQTFAFGNKRHLVRVNSLMSAEGCSSIQELPFDDRSDFEILDYDSGASAVVMKDQPKNCRDFLIRAYSVSSTGPIEFRENSLTLDNLPKDSDLVKCIIAEGRRVPQIRKLDDLVYLFAGLSYLAVVDLRNSQNPVIRSFEFVKNVVLNEDYKVAACEDLRALSCPGSNSVSLLQVKRDEESQSDKILDSRLIKLNDGEPGVKMTADLVINLSSRLIKVKEGRFLYLGQGANIADRGTEREDGSNKELDHLRRCSVFGFEFNSDGLEVTQKGQNGSFLNYLNNWEINLNNIIGVGGFLVASASDRSKSDGFYLTLLSPELEVLSQFKRIKLRDADSLICFGSSGQIITFSDQNSFMLHKIDPDTKELILVKTLKLDCGVTDIRFSQHLNTPKKSFLTLITDSREIDFLVELSDNLELKEQKTYSVTQGEGFVVLHNKHLFFDIAISERNSISKRER